MEIRADISNLNMGALNDILTRSHLRFSQISASRIIPELNAKARSIVWCRTLIKNIHVFWIKINRTGI